jgi:hypothetical protein
MRDPSIVRCCLAIPVVVVILSALALPSPAAGACEAGEHRQFDFWLGEWNVKTPNGQIAGVNVITSEYGGCVIHERYTTSRGFSGESLNAYDPGRKVWHQTWVDTAGSVLLIEGGMRDGSMVLEGETTGADGQVTKHRITYTPNDKGGLRQHWESSGADGKWTTTFDGAYSRK